MRSAKLGVILLLAMGLAASAQCGSVRHPARSPAVAVARSYVVGIFGDNRGAHARRVRTTTLATGR